MKQLFLTLCAFGLLICMAMPATAADSVSQDDDVGYNNGAVAAPNATTTEPSPMMAQAVDQPECTAGITYTTLLPATMPETVTLIPVQWSGGDTKASRREAMLINGQCRFVLEMRNDGKEARRLSCKAKA